jgi:hypothetical protein
MLVERGFVLTMDKYTPGKRHFLRTVLPHWRQTGRAVVETADDGDVFVCVERRSPLTDRMLAHDAVAALSGSSPIVAGARESDAFGARVVVAMPGAGDDALMELLAAAVGTHRMVVAPTLGVTTWRRDLQRVLRAHAESRSPAEILVRVCASAGVRAVFATLAQERARIANVVCVVNCAALRSDGLPAGALDCAAAGWCSVVAATNPDAVSVRLRARVRVRNPPWRTDRPSGARARARCRALSWSSCAWRSVRAARDWRRCVRAARCCVRSVR